MLVRTQKGYVLALSGSILLLTTALATFVLVFCERRFSWYQQRTLGSLMTGSMFPTILQIMWFSMVVVSALCISHYDLWLSCPLVLALPGRRERDVAGLAAIAYHYRRDLL